MTKRVAVYARYSSHLQKATSIADQVMMAERFCDRQGWTIIKIYTDEEKSGKDTRRPGFQAMQAAANNREFDVVVVEAIDRLTRKVKDALNMFDLFTFRDIELHSIQEGPQDFLKVLFAGFGAQMFSEKIADHTRRGMQGAITRQRLHSLAYGYRKRDVKTGLNRVIDPKQAEIVHRIFREFAARKSTNAIATGLNLDRIPAPNGGTWESSSLRGNPARQEGILRNRLYIGIASVCKNTHSYHPETGTKKIKSTPEETVEQEIPELRIIEQPLWDAVQAELAHRAAVTPKQARAARRKTYLLSGMLTCGCCGAPYVIISRTSYGCREARKKACNNTVAISRKRIEGRVFGALRQAFRSPELIAQFEASMEAERKKLAGGSLDEEMARLQAALRKAEAGRENILNAIADGALYASFRAKADALEAEVADLTARIVRVEAQRAHQALPQEDASTVFERVLKQMEQLLSHPEFVDEANSYLRMLVGQVTLTPDETAPHGLEAVLELASEALMPKGPSQADEGQNGLCQLAC